MKSCESLLFNDAHKKLAFIKLGILFCSTNPVISKRPANPFSNKVSSILKSLEGVEEFSVDFESSTVEVLFDDYGGFNDTRKIVDNFLKDKKGHFINYPTGQGVFIKL